MIGREVGLARDDPVKLRCRRDLFRVVAAQEMMERRTRLLSDLRERGAVAVEVPSPELAGSVIDRYLGVKERNLL